jgi:hypothetical protein
MTMRGTPETLTNQEVELDVQPLTQTPIPVPARAWVRYTGVEMRLDLDHNYCAETNGPIAICAANRTGA